MTLLPLLRTKYRECRGLVHANVVAHVVSCDAPRRVLLLPSSVGTSYITFPPMLIEMEFKAYNSVKAEGQRFVYDLTYLQSSVGGQTMQEKRRQIIC